MHFCTRIAIFRITHILSRIELNVLHETSSPQHYTPFSCWTPVQNKSPSYQKFPSNSAPFLGHPISGPFLITSPLTQIPFGIWPSLLHNNYNRHQYLQLLFFKFFQNPTGNHCNQAINIRLTQNNFLASQNLILVHFIHSTPQSQASNDLTKTRADLFSVLI